MRSGGRGLAERALVAAVALSAPVAAGAQLQAEPVRFEVRIDALAAARDTPAAVHLGAGAARRFGMFQLGMVAAAGPSRDGVSARAEAVARFHVDPFRQRSWGLYGGAGAGVHWADGAEPLLLVTMGVEGPRGRNGWSPALEVGLARGLRVAVALRRTPPQRR